MKKNLFFEILEVVMKIKMLIFVTLFLLPSSRLFVQEIHDCMCVSKLNEIITGDTTLYGEWALDTCDIGIEGNCIELLRGMLTNPNNSVNYTDRLFSKSRFKIWVDTILISRSSSTLTSFSWEDIDDDFIEIKQGLEGLENNYGGYSLIPRSTWEIDSISNSQIFRLEFENFVNIEEVLDFLYHINDSVSGDLYLHSKYEWIYEILYLNNFRNKEDNKIFIYPNPAEDYIVIDFGNYNGASPIVSDIKIYDIYGSTVTCYGVENMSNYKIDISQLPAGMYFVRINDKVLSFVKE